MTLKPGDMVRASRRLHQVRTYERCISNEDLGAIGYRLGGGRTDLIGSAIVVADPGYLGGRSNALLLLMPSGGLRWAWSRKLVKVT